MKTLKLVLLVLFLALTSSGYSQTVKEITKVIDLAELEPGTEKKYEIENRVQLNLMLLNKVPSQKYIVQTEITRKEIQPYNVLVRKNTKTRNEKDTTQSIDPCLAEINKFIKKLDLLKEEKNEKKIPELKNEIEKFIREKDPNCEDKFSSIITAKHNLLSKTEEIVNNVAFANNKIIKVTVKRDDDPSKEWTLVYETEDRGVWLESYGISYISNLFKQNKTFIAVSNGNDGSTVEANSNDRGNGAFVPSIFYSWLPSAGQNSDFNFGLGGGLGLDLLNPVAMAAFNINYNWNLNIFMGLAYWKDKTPNPSYKLGQTISASEVSNLNIDKYVLSPFIAFTFRVGSNPFEKDVEKKEPKK